MKTLYSFLLLFAILQIEAQNVIFSQPVYYYSSGGTSAILSAKAQNGEQMSVASRFVLSTPATLTKIKIFGTQIAQNLPTISTGLILHIYADNNGEPNGNPIQQTGTPLYSIDINSNSPAYTFTNWPLFSNSIMNGFTYHIDLSALPGAPTLQANVTYWLYFIPKLSIPSIQYMSESFNWLRHDPATPSLKAISNLTGAAAYPTWTAVGTGGAAFSIEGLTELGTEETIHDSSIVIFPNPVTDIVSIKSVEKIKSLSILDASGRVVAIPQDKIQFDFSGMPAGNYILRIQTESNTTSHKIIKK